MKRKHEKYRPSDFRCRFDLALGWHCISNAIKPATKTILSSGQQLNWSCE